MLDRSIFDLSFSYFQRTDRTHTLMRTCANQPLSCADACLVRMAEAHPGRAIVMTDDNFHVYRTAEESLEVRVPNS